MRIKHRSDQVLRHDNKPAPGHQAEFCKHDQMSSPHGYEHDGAHQPELNGYCEYLLVGIARGDRRGTAARGHGLAEQRMDRSGAMTSQGRLRDELQRLAPELHTKSGGGDSVFGSIERNLVFD